MNFFVCHVSIANLVLPGAKRRGERQLEETLSRLIRGTHTTKEQGLYRAERIRSVIRSSGHAGKKYQGSIWLLNKYSWDF